MVVLNKNALHKVNDWTLELEEKIADIIPHVQKHWKQRWWFNEYTIPSQGRKTNYSKSVKHCSMTSI